MIDFPPSRGSIFDDPGDEKSWHVSQRSESLSQFYKDREPSWYASAVAPLKGADRVLDLGCGPGLALQALLAQGSSSVLGVDRWPAFTARSTAAAPIVAHDLTLPMPFLESGSFDGVLSHYALYYMSPIGVRQVLREANRVLTPGGRLVICVAATGMASGDEARTAAYSQSAFQALLAEAGFVDIDVEESSNGRNTIAKARHSSEGEASTSMMGLKDLRVQVKGDTQLSAAFINCCDDRIECELVGSKQNAVLSFDLPQDSGSDDGSRISVCARVIPLAPGGTELQFWLWSGHHQLSVSECFRLEFESMEVRVSRPGDVEHSSAWTPAELSIEPMGSAYVRLSDLPPGAERSEAERGAEGRLVAVESDEAGDDDVSGRLGPGRNRFLIRRAGTDLSSIDDAWLSGRVHGLSFSAEELIGPCARELLLWAGWRQALVFVSGSRWEEIVAAVSQSTAEICSPVALVDPDLNDDHPPQALPPEVATLMEVNSWLFAILSRASRKLSAHSDLNRLSKRILHGGPASESEAPAMQEANAALGYLTERTVLMRLRQSSGHSPVEVGRRSVSV